VVGPKNGCRRVKLSVSKFLDAIQTTKIDTKSKGSLSRVLGQPQIMQAFTFYLACHPHSFEAARKSVVFEFARMIHANLIST
jgi:hypothetical protein